MAEIREQRSKRNCKTRHYGNVNTIPPAAAGLLPSPASLDSGVEFFAQPVGEQVESQNEKDQGCTRKDDQPPVPDIDVVLAACDHHAERGFCDGNPHAQKTQGRFQTERTRSLSNGTLYLS